jgi:hypothetical protein
MIDTFVFPVSCTKAINAGVPAIDVLHGELKNLMYQTEQALAEYVDHENEQYDQTVDRLHLEGYLDALTYVYILAQQIDFNIIDRNSNEARG